jgi:hypothetical protein
VVCGFLESRAEQEKGDFENLFANDADRPSHLGSTNSWSMDVNVDENEDEDEEFVGAK